jgi:signal transduction histidine kinase
VTLFASEGPPRVVVAHEEITQTRLAGDWLKEKNEELERFTYAVSHDLRSPLVTIMTFLQFLDDDMARNDTEAIARDIALMSTAAGKMKTMLDELLQLSRAGRVASEPVETSLQEIARQALELVAGRIAQRGVRVTVSPEQLMVYGDQARLIEAFQNLIENAVKFMGDQEDPVVEIGGVLKGGQTLVFIRDNGIGIDPQNQGRLFGLFEKLNPSAEGSGLGLALTKRIVEKHGGRIWVESKGLGAGTCFWLALPQKKVQN